MVRIQTEFDQSDRRKNRRSTAGKSLCLRAVHSPAEGRRLVPRVWFGSFLPCRTTLVALSLTLILVAATSEGNADQCDATAGELAARVPGVNIGRRSSVTIFAFHPAVKYSSIGCLNAKSVNFFAEVESRPISCQLA